LLIAFAVVLSALVPIPAHAATVSFNCPSGGGTYQVNDATGTLTGTTGTCSGALTLDNSVTAFGDYALSSAQLTSLTLPAGFTTFSHPFWYDNYLTSINVNPANTNFVAEDGVLFNSGKTTLVSYPSRRPGTSYSIPSTVNAIGMFAFQANRILTQVTISGNITSIGDYAFNAAQALRTVEIGATVTSFGQSALHFSPNLETVTVSASNLNYSSDANGILYNKNKSTLIIFPAANLLTLYTTPNTVTSIYVSAFSYTKNLLTADFSSVTTLTGQTFMDSSSIQEVTFGNSITTLNSQTFQSASALKRVYLGTGFTTIVDGSFYGNNRLYCVIYGGSNSTIQNYSYPNMVVPVATSASCLADPAFTLSSSTETAVTGTSIAGYTVSSTGGTIANYSISPAITNTPGLSFSTTTGLITGTPSTAASSRTYTITATNAANTATRTFAITVNPAAPAFTLSSSSISATTGVVTSGYTISSTGGTIASYSISPAISNTPGLVFSTSTGLISGTPTTAATSFTYTVTATNATNSATRTFAITVIAPTPEYVAPVPVPYLKTLTTPKLNLKDGKLVCTPGTYNSGYTLDGVVQGSTMALFSPSTFTYNLLINGVAQISLAVTSASSSNSWNLSVATSGSLIACSVTVSANSLTNTDKSSDNTSATSSALTTQTTSIATANADYSALLSANSMAYQKALVDNRAKWRSDSEKIRTDYYAERDRIKSLPSTMTTRAQASGALKAYTAAQKKSAADYKASQPAAATARDAANKAALDAKSAAIAKANATYGTFIESVGYGVLIP
jgi:hypothetical protein